MGIKLDAHDILTSDDAYPDRLLAAPTEVIHNAEVLALVICDLLEHYGKRPRISSGYRTAEANKAAGGAANSSHCVSRAVDFSDPKGEFARWCLNNIGVLASLELHMENPDKTRGWVHLTDRPPRSGKIVFDP